MVAVSNWIMTPRSVVLILDNGLPLTIVEGDNRFLRAKELVAAGKFDDVLAMADRAVGIETKTEGKFTVQDGVIIIDGETLPQALSAKLLELVDAGEDTLALENFWDNLRKNPTESSRKDLFAFLQANNVPITRDGCFIVYKKVRQDYWDSHTGKTHQNRPGMIVTMPRDTVDQNRNHTCSAGLHVAAFEYASNFTGERLMECKVNPMDVVAVPPDYNEQKMRVCRYQVVRETTTKYEEPLYSADQGVELAPLVEDQAEVLVVAIDTEGRLRIPGRLIRKHLRVGVGRRAAVFVNEGFLNVMRGTRGDDAEFNYTAQTDNCIRISKHALEQACGEGFTEFSIIETELDDGNALEITGHA